MKESLRLSLDTALQFRTLIDIFRNAIKIELNGDEDVDLEGHADRLNDELIVVMLTTYKGLLKLLDPLADATEIINNRISWLEDKKLLEKEGMQRDGFEKRILEVIFEDEQPYEFPEGFESDYDLGDDNEEEERFDETEEGDL